MVDIREFFQNDNGDLKPGKKGKATKDLIRV